MQSKLLPIYKSSSTYHTIYDITNIIGFCVFLSQFVMQMCRTQLDTYSEYKLQEVLLCNVHAIK